MTEPTLLVTNALPYANGHLHLGHMVGYIQADIWVRAQRMQGKHCIYVCADDAHGTPIMLKAREQEITPEALIDAMQKEHEHDFKAFFIHFDAYGSTHSQENQTLTEDIYLQLKKAGYITQKTISQAYDPVAKLFLPDRFVKGECPRCHAKDQYGDSCEACGSTYSTSDLIHPRSVVSGEAPIQKESLHYFFNLPDFQAFLQEWIQAETLQPEIRNKLKEWLHDGLIPWDISRDAPYFGFKIPGEEDKYFYVWLDAPIGYMAATRQYTHKKNKPELFDQLWGKNSTAELYHFIGKDIIYFHALFWPAMLNGSNYRLPTAIFANGFLTINGQKMSKSRGTFITARDYLKHFNPEYLRYYFAAKLNADISDLDLNLTDFMQRVNADLVGKLVNIASRCAKLLESRTLPLAEQLPSHPLWQQVLDCRDSIFAGYEQREFQRAIRETMALADQVNQYLADAAPWQLIKDPENVANAQAICTLGINLFSVLVHYLSPVIPKTATAVHHWLKIEIPMQPLLGYTMPPYEPLLTRIDPSQITQLEQSILIQDKKPVEKKMQETMKNAISIDDFNKIDLRIARILNAEAIPEAEKLLKLTVDVGEENPRTIFAGIKSAYTPEQLIGRLTIVVANLEPRKMRFGVSEGMVALAGNSGAELWLLSPDAGAQPGMRVK